MAIDLKAIRARQAEWVAEVATHSAGCDCDREAHADIEILLLEIDRLRAIVGESAFSYDDVLEALPSVAEAEMLRKPMDKAAQKRFADALQKFVVAFNEGDDGD